MSEFERENIKNGNFRVVRNAKRKRLLDKRGENIWWSPSENGWVWNASRNTRLL